MFSQLSFDSYLNNIFFNVFSEISDLNIKNFIKTFAPALIRPLERQTEWTIYPKKQFSTIQFNIAHSYFFKSHPFFEAPIEEGEFKIYTSFDRFLKNQNKMDIKNIEVIMKFNKKKDANKWFNKIRTDLSELSEENIFYEDKSGKYFVKWGKSSSYRVPSQLKVQLITIDGRNPLYQLKLFVN